jgi:RNA polymerase sigma-70 factor (ECF subfamily)
MAQPDIDRVIIGCNKGDEGCFTQLVDIYGRRCFGYFYRLTGNRDLSDELLSELFAKLVEKIGTYRGGSFDGWIFTMASNIFHDHLRFKQRQKRLLDEHSRRIKSQSAGVVVGGKDDDADKLQMVLGELDSDVRELVMMRFYSQMSFKEIAESRREPIGTILSKVHRGLKKLRELMG